MSIQPVRSLCVFCGSRIGLNPEYAETARYVGRRLAEEGIRLIYGGGSVGLMGETADACLAAGGEVIGVITERLMSREVGHRGVSALEIVDTMLERKTRMAELSDAFVSLPGAVGTIDELFEMVTWNQLGVQRKPNALLNVAGYYDGLIAFMKTMVSEGFLQQPHLEELWIETNFDTLLNRFQTSAMTEALQKV